MKKILLLVVVIIFFSFSFPKLTSAQTATPTPSPTPAFEDIGVGIGQLIQIKDLKAQEGDIVSYNNKGYFLSGKAYDPSIIGVISNLPAVTLEDKVEKNDQYILTSGTALVRVTAANGAIKVGDLISTSKTKGVGQKSTQEGYIIGNALEPYSAKGVGKIEVSIHPGFNTSTITLRTNLLNSFNLALSSPFQSPVNALRYFMAGIIAILALGAGLMFFGRVTSRGIEALGRNPLATTAIIISIIINLVLALGIMAVGIGIAYFVLIL